MAGGVLMYETRALGKELPDSSRSTTGTGWPTHSRREVTTRAQCSTCRNSTSRTATVPRFHTPSVAVLKRAGGQSNPRRRCTSRRMNPGLRVVVRLPPLDRAVCCDIGGRLVFGLFRAVRSDFFAVHRIEGGSALGLAFQFGVRHRCQNLVPTLPTLGGILGVDCPALLASPVHDSILCSGDSTVGIIRMSGG